MGMSRDKERHGSVERSRSRDLSKEREKDVSADSENVEKKSIDQNDEDNPLDKKEEARLKLKELISKNRHTVEDVKRKREREDDRERMEMEAELEREKRSRAYERDGDWHCADPECRVINFKKNSECIRCHKPKPEKAVFWDVPEFQESSKKKKDKKEKKKREKEEGK